MAPPLVTGTSRGLGWRVPAARGALLGAVVTLLACGPGTRGPGPAGPDEAFDEGGAGDDPGFAAPARRPPAAPGAAASRPATQPSATRPSASVPASGPACNSWVVEYELVRGTRLRISDTPMGAGDGSHRVGPGRMVLRFVDRGGRPGPGGAALLALELATRFTVVSDVMGFSVKVRTNAHIDFQPDRCGVIARGVFLGDQVAFTEPARGYRSRGWLRCSGSACGRFGAPPHGRSRVRVGPSTVRLRRLRLAHGVSQVTMPYAVVERSQNPSQTTRLRVVAREVRRHCEVRPVCSTR